MIKIYIGEHTEDLYINTKEKELLNDSIFFYMPETGLNSRSQIEKGKYIISEFNSRSKDTDLYVYTCSRQLVNGMVIKMLKDHRYLFDIVSVIYTDETGFRYDITIDRYGVWSEFPKDIFSASNDDIDELQRVRQEVIDGEDSKKFKTAYIIVKDYFNDSNNNVFTRDRNETVTYCFISYKTADECKKLLIDTVLKNKDKENKGFTVPFEGIFIDPYHFRRLNFEVKSIESYHSEIERMLSKGNEI